MKIRYLTTLFKWIRLCKNWHSVIALHFGLTKGDIFLTLRNGLKLKLINNSKDSDTVVLADIYFNEPYTKGFNIKNDDVVVDIGSNVGIFSTYVCAISKNAKVFSYEASPKNFEYLKYNILNNRLQNRITSYNLAVMGEKGKIKLFINEGRSGGHSVYEKRVISKKYDFVEVPAITLKDIFITNRISQIDFLKIDCEGAEYEILFNTPKEYLERIKKIGMEWHKIDRYSIDDLEKFLLENKYELSKNGSIIRAHRK